MVQLGMFVAVTTVWIGCMVFVYKNMGKDGDVNEDENDRKREKNAPNPRSGAVEKPALVENFREPIFPNKKKMWCDNYPRANMSIYGEYSHMLSGYPSAYAKAY
jgi:hypothetical protein